MQCNACEQYPYCVLVMERKSITIEDARKKLGVNAERMTDKQVNDLLNILRVICNKVIDSVVNKIGSN